MKGIILCQFRSDRPEARAALDRCLAWPVLSGRANVLFTARTARSESADVDTTWAISLGSLVEAEAIVKTWKAREPGLRTVAIQCLRQTEDDVMEMQPALFP